MRILTSEYFRSAANLRDAPPRGKRQATHRQLVAALLLWSSYGMALILSPHQVFAQETAAPSTPPNTNKIPTDANWDAREQRLLAKDYTGETVWLESNGEKILALWQNDLSGQPLGALLILHEEGARHSRPAHLDNLARILPQLGWATLTLVLPHSPQPMIPKRSPRTLVEINSTTNQANNEEQKPSSDAAASNEAKKVDETKVVFDDGAAEKTSGQDVNQTSEARNASSLKPPPAFSADEIEALGLQMLQAGVTHLKDQGHFNIVLMGEGRGAWYALKHLAQDQSKPQLAVKQGDNSRAQALIDRNIRALVLLDAQTPNTNSIAPQEAGNGEPKTEDLKSIMVSADVPTLDIYIEDFDQAQALATQRKQVAQLNQFSYYRQRRMVGFAMGRADFETALAKTVRGFLSQHAKGKKLE